MLEKLLERIKFELNTNEDFFSKAKSLKEDRYYGISLILTKQELLFLKNILEDVENFS